MRLGDPTVLFLDRPLESALNLAVELGLDTVEIPAGGFFDTSHLDPTVLGGGGRGQARRRRARSRTGDLGPGAPRQPGAPRRGPGATPTISSSRPHAASPNS